METNLKNLSALKSIAEILNQSLDLEQALHRSLKIILEILDLKTAWIFLKKPGKPGFHLAAHEGLPPGLHPGEKVWHGGCQCNSLACANKLTDAVNIVRCTRLEEATGDIGNLEVHASVPLETPRSQIGIFNVATNDGSRFSDENLQLLTAVGYQMGVAIERGLMFNQVHDQRLREQESLLKLSRALLEAGSLEGVLDEIVKVSAEIFAADMCLISLKSEPDQDKGHRLMAGVGLPFPLTDPRFEACWLGTATQKLNRLGRPGHVLLPERSDAPPVMRLFPLEEPVSKEDLTAICGDSETWGFCRDMACRSILMAPIRSVTSGEILGSLSVAHREPKELVPDAHLTELLANQAALAIEQVRLNQIRSEKKAMEHELIVAREIQTGFLPERAPSLPGWEMACLYEAAQEVGGDFYDFIELPNGNWGLVIADVSGKGVPAALIMAVSRTLVRAVALQKANPLEAIETVNRILLSESRHDRFLSLFYAELQPDSGRLKYVRAGHNPPLLWSRRKRTTSPLQGEGMVLGVADLDIFEEREVRLEPGDTVVFYTDGLTEAMDGKNREYGEDRLERFLNTNHGLGAKQLAGELRKDVLSFVKGAPPSDDLTLVVLKRDFIAK